MDWKATYRAMQAAGYSDWLAANETALDYIVTRIASKFGVSEEVIAKRFWVEKLWLREEAQIARSVIRR